LLPSPVGGGVDGRLSPGSAFCRTSLKHPRRNVSSHARAHTQTDRQRRMISTSHRTQAARPPAERKVARHLLIYYRSRPRPAKAEESSMKPSADQLHYR